MTFRTLQQLQSIIKKKQEEEKGRLEKIIELKKQREDYHKEGGEHLEQKDMERWGACLQIQKIIERQIKYSGGKLDE